jgi:hypothetical protein
VLADAEPRVDVLIAPRTFEQSELRNDAKEQGHQEADGNDVAAWAKNNQASQAK